MDYLYTKAGTRLWHIKDVFTRYVGIEPPTVKVDRDFDYYRLIGQDVSVLAQLNEMGKISDPLLLEILRRGEILPDNLDISDELERLPAPTTDLE